MRRGKYEKKRTPIVNVAMAMAMVLFWLVIITTYMTSGLFARYSTMDSGSDSARVITFGNLTVVDTDDKATEQNTYYFAPGIPLKKQITVSFTGSEADVYVFICVETPSWTRQDDDTFVIEMVPDPAKPNEKLQALSWKLNSEDWTYLLSDGNRHVYYIRLDTNQTLASTNVLAGEGVIDVSPNITRTLCNVLRSQDIEINVTGYVIQANGFSGETPAQDAWAALNP